MLYRSRAPLRIGLAGGGTDVSPYSDIYGGVVLNATINLYAHAAIRPLKNGRIVIHNINQNKKCEYAAGKKIKIGNELPLHQGVYNRIVQEFTKQPLAFELVTELDAPPASGLGTSSTLVVAILGAFVEWLKLPLSDYEIARLAYEIERLDLKMAGGRQDQYAATFGGINFMEFRKTNDVIVNPLRIRSCFLNELERCLLLYYTQTPRHSSLIIQNQSKNIQLENKKALTATHKLKEQALLMKEILLKGEIEKIGTVLDFGWQNKKKIAETITNPIINKVYQTAIKAGATGGKISGAGGGGFMTFFCPGNTRYKVIETLEKLGGEVKKYQFTNDGLTRWTTKQ